MIEIDRDGCAACATCYTIDPKQFESSAEGKSKNALPLLLHLITEAFGNRQNQILK